MRNQIYFLQHRATHTLFPKHMPFPGLPRPHPHDKTVGIWARSTASADFPRRKPSSVKPEPRFIIPSRDIPALSRSLSHAHPSSRDSRRLYSPVKSSRGRTEWRHGQGIWVLFELPHQRHLHPPPPEPPSEPGPHYYYAHYAPLIHPSSSISAFIIIF